MVTPGAFQAALRFLSKPDEVRRDYTLIGGLSLGQSGLARLDTTQRGFPTLLQLCRNQPIAQAA